MAKSLIIDAHHHWLPDDQYRRPELYIRPDEEVIYEADRFRIERAGVQLFSPPRITSRMEAQLKLMDRARIDRAILHAGIWFDWLDMRAARQINEGLAELKRQHPNRIIPLAHIPPFEAEASRELKRAVVDMGFTGVALNTHIKGTLLDHERLYPFYKAVSDLDVPIMVHPASELPLAHPHGMEQYNLTRSLGRSMDTTINIARLMLSGTMERFPKLRFVFAHMGGAWFALKNRLNPSFWDKRSRNFFDKFKNRVFVDTAPPFWRSEEIRLAVETMGENQIMMGSDFPTIDLMRDAITIVQQAKISSAAKKKILGDNAGKLFRISP